MHMDGHAGYVPENAVWSLYHHGAALLCGGGSVGPYSGGATGLHEEAGIPCVKRPKGDGMIKRLKCTKSCRTP